jgi:tetratricopeptide (TPR) repeat protein
MRASLAAMTLLAGSVIGGGAASAHDPEGHADSVSGELGTTHFPNSGAPGAQPDFLRGLLLLHSFEYAAGRRSFQAAEREDPGFAMAYWDEALTYNHTLWGEQDLGAARAALAKLGATPEERAAKARSARERAYLAPRGPRARGAITRCCVTGVTRSWLDNITTQEIEQATLMATVLAGTIRYYEGEKSAGIAQIREAIGSADRMMFEYGPPWSVKPFDEVLGELLLADGRREEAAAAFQKTLAVYPNRRLAREGLAASQVIH